MVRVKQYKTDNFVLNKYHRVATIGGGTVESEDFELFVDGESISIISLDKTELATELRLLADALEADK